MSVRRQFWKFVLPAMISFAFTGVYAIVDGVFVGQNIGDAGLAAINLAYPLTALLQATGAGVGMAGAVVSAIAMGRGDEARERRGLGGALTLLLLSGLALTALLFLLRAPLLRLLGAQGRLLELAASYIAVIALGSLFQVLGTGLLPLIRNYDGSLAAMGAMIAGFAVNIALDWLFVSRLQWGMAGAAAATVAGQCVTLVPCLVFLARKGRLFRFAVFRLDGPTARALLRTALSPWGLTLSPNLVIVILNRGAVAYGDETAVAAYAVASYALCVVQLLIQGVGDGAQPQLSRYYGAGDAAALAQVRRLTLAFSPATAAVGAAVLWLSRGLIPVLFGASAGAAALYRHMLPCFLAGLLFLGVLRAVTSYFYATEQHARSYLLIYGEPLLLAALVGLALPRLWGLDGVWLAVPAAQAVLAAAALLLLRRGAAGRTL